MPIQEHRAETYYVTANSAESARDELIARLGNENYDSYDGDRVFDDRDEAERAAADARKFKHLTGDNVYAVTLEVKSC